MIELKGLDSLDKEIAETLKKYPYESEIVLRRVATKFRQEVKKDTPVGKSNRKKLVNRYHVTHVKGYGKDLRVDFYAKAPHYHLVERGHRIVKKDKTDTGRRVEGRYMVRNNIKKFENGEFKSEIDKMAKRVLKGLMK